MSETSRGPGWWLASDGRWYPPETWTGPPPAAGGWAGPGPGAGIGTGAVTGPATWPAATNWSGGPWAGGPMTVARPTNGMAIASLACACGGLFFFGIPALLGIIFGFISRSQINRSQGTQSGGGLALAGILVGFVVVALYVALLSLALVLATTHNCGTTVAGCTVD
jgi:hypothetical protein